MKIFIIFLLLFIALGCSKSTETTCTLTKNCTGNYIKINTKYFKICNNYIVSTFKNNDIVQVKYCNISDCNSDSFYLCEMNFNYNGWVEIEEIKQ